MLFPHSPLFGEKSSTHLRARTGINVTSAGTSGDTVTTVEVTSMPTLARSVEPKVGGSSSDFRSYASTNLAR